MRELGGETGETMMEDVPHAETPLKVLVVDDQADSADAVAFMLSLMGHDVHTAYGPREALDKFRQVRPAVVFMDISMPELSGLEAAARIRSMPEGTSTTIIALTVASQLSNIAALGLWGTLIDRYSNKAVLQISAPLFLACTLAWTFTGLAWIGSATIYLLAVIHVLMGVATAGVALASGNIVMKLSPSGQATAYLAASCVVTATCGAIAPVIGGLCADFFAARELTLAFTWTGGVGQVTVQVLDFHSWTFFFGLACVAGLYSLHRLSFVEEPSGTTDRLVLRHLLLEARRSLRSLSSAAGLLRVVRLPQWFSRP